MPITVADLIESLKALPSDASLYEIMDGDLTPIMTLSDLSGFWYSRVENQLYIELDSTITYTGGKDATSLAYLVKEIEKKSK